MPKVLVELKEGTVISVETTSEDVEVYVVDHDVISEGTAGEVKRYLASLDAPIDVDGLLLEEDLMTKLEDIVVEGKARLEDMTSAWEDEDEEPEELSDLPNVIRHRR
ncbi:MAG TPA: hypothetical protein VMT71_13770 [Syntrophorhabdales bacterium]|nr:hypothetical protein [Syntrophorhabdales bacterium]